MFEWRKIYQSHHIASSVVLFYWRAQLPLVAIAQCGHRSIRTNRFDFQAPTRIERIGCNPVGELYNAMADGVFAQDFVVDDFVAVGQMRLDPSDGGVGVEALQEVEAMAGPVEEVAGLMDDQGLKRADLPAVDDGFHLVVARVEATIGTHIERDTVGLTDFDDAVGFGHGGRESFFGVDRAGPGVGGGDDDFGAVLGLRGDADDIGFFAFEQFAIVCVLSVRGDAVTGAHLGHHVGAQIGAGD